MNCRIGGVVFRPAAAPVSKGEHWCSVGWEVGSVRPMALGYWVRPGAEAGRDSGTLSWALREQVTAVARVEGYALARCFVDVAGAGDSALRGLVAALRDGVAVAVIVADLAHLQHAPCLAGADLGAAARFLRCRLVVAGFCAGPFDGVHLVQAVGA